jgi:hypothetical protein
MIRQSSEAQALCDAMESPTKADASHRAAIEDAQGSFRKIVLGSNNLIFVTSAVNREKANYNKVDPTYDPSRCIPDKTETVNACRMYMEGVKVKASTVASELATLFEEAIKQVQGEQVTLGWASKIETGIDSALKL